MNISIVIDAQTIEAVWTLGSIIAIVESAFIGLYFRKMFNTKILRRLR